MQQFKKFFTGNLGLIISGIIFLAIISFSIFQIYSIEKTSKALLKQTQMAQNSIRKNDWINANTSMQKLDEQWTQTKCGWALFLDHKKMDLVDEAVKRSLKFVELRSKAESSAELNIASHLISEISEEQFPRFINIF